MRSLYKYRLKPFNNSNIMLKKIKIKITSLLLIVCTFSAGAVHAGAVNEVPGIYAISQNGTCEGVVKDKTGVAAVGASVLVKGTTNGTITDMNGGFSLEDVKQGDVIRISYIGYLTQEIKWNGKPMNVVLEDDIKILDDVVVTALGIKRKQKALSYNVQELKGNTLLDVKDVNPINALAGKIAGVDISTSASGIGGATRVVMRGTKSITKDNNTLYVIDGIPIYNSNRGGLSENTEYQNPTGGEGISDLNPEDIESMSILTGPAAAALYGSLAANGAVIITTKRGIVGKPKVVVSNQVSFSRPFVMPFFQNKYGNAKGAYASWGDKTDKNYDPKDYFDTGVQLQTSVNLSMGSEKSQTYFSFSNTEADGIIPGNNYGKNSLSARNTTHFLNDKLTLDFDFTYIKQRDANMVAQGQYYNPLVPVYTYPRNENFNEVKEYETYNSALQLYSQNWDWKDQNLTMQNPYWIQHRNPAKNKKDRYMMSVSLKYDILSWLNVAGRLRIDNATNDYTQKRYYGTTEKLVSEGKSAYKAVITKNKQTYADVIANIDKRFADYTINASIGASYSDIRSIDNGINGALVIPNFFSWTNIDREDKKLQTIEDGWHEQTQSIFASAELGWKSMLYLTLTGRGEWASPLANTESSSFFYPSVGLSGILSEMLTLPKEISYLQVRGAFARVGTPIPRNISIMTYPKKDNAWTTTTFMPPSGLKPEWTNSWEVGISSKFFGNALSFDFTWYKSNTKNQTLNIKLSGSSAYESMYIQTGNVQNTGIETRLGTNLRLGEVSWATNITASYNKNKIISLMDGDYYDNKGNLLDNIQNLSQGGVGAAEIILRKGGTMGDLYIKSALKRDDKGNIAVNNEGNPILESLGGDDLIYAGSVLPKWNLGFRNDFSWKNVNLGFLISGRFGGVVVSHTQAILEGFGVGENSAKARDNAGVPTGAGTMIDAKKYYETTGSQQGLMGDYVYKADNIRLAELSLGYTMPKSWFNNLMNIHVAFVGRNLLMLKNSAPFDPQGTASTDTYYQGIDYFMQPTTRNLGFQVRIEF